jgi:hypothetical protein
MSRWGRTAALAAAMMFALGLLRSPAGADDPVARANALFEEGKKLLDAGHVAEACVRLDESYRLAPRGGTLLNLGLCHEREGRLLVARRELRDALAMARRDGRADREPVAREHLAAVETKLAWIAVTPPPNVATSVEIRVDGAPIAQADWSAVPVEPGRHVVAASAEKFRAREVTVTIAEGGRTETVRFEALEPIVAATPDAPAPSPSPAPSSSAVAPAPTATHDVLPAPRSDTARTAALVAGIAGVAISVATGAWALERKGVVSSECSSTSKQCSPTGADAASTGRALVIVSTIAFAIGGAGFGAWLLLPRADAPQSARGLGFTVQGTF